MTTSIKFSVLKNLSPISLERRAESDTFKDTDFSDCPELTEEEWLTAGSFYAKPPKLDVHVRSRGLAQRAGKGYQVRMNAALRYTMQNGF